MQQIPVMLKQVTCNKKSLTRKVYKLFFKAAYGDVQAEIKLWILLANKYPPVGVGKWEITSYPDKFILEKIDERNEGRILK